MPPTTSNQAEARNLQRITELLEQLASYDDLRAACLLGLMDDQTPHPVARLAQAGLKLNAGATTRQLFDYACPRLGRTRRFDRELRDAVWPRLRELGIVQRAYVLTNAEAQAAGKQIEYGRHKAKSPNNSYALTDEAMTLLVETNDADWTAALEALVTGDADRRLRVLQATTSVAAAANDHAELIQTAAKALQESVLADYELVFVDDADGERIKDEWLEIVLGRRPNAVVGDRGYSVSKVFRLNSERGIASVFPWRKSNQNDHKVDGYVSDRHGVPRCKHCGAPTEFVRFSPDPKPRLWFRCLGAQTPECVPEQTIACAKNWRALLLLWRNDPVYMELRDTHGEFEAVHDYWRDRYKVAAASLGQRPKRRGRDWQQLRASAALFVEWLRICSREGWLGDERTNCKQAHARMQKGARAAVHLRDFRTRIGLNAPYGPKAVAAYSCRRYRHTPHERWEIQLRWQERCKTRKAETRRATRAAA